MATNYQVVLYGASGYTGKLTAWKLAERGIPFIAAGRNAARIEQEMAKVPELKGHDYQCVSVAHDRGALTELFSGKKAVINIVGPFMQLGRPVVEACLKAGAHYFDTTGEVFSPLLITEFLASIPNLGTLSPRLGDQGPLYAVGGGYSARSAGTAMSATRDAGGEPPFRLGRRVWSPQGGVVPP